MSIPFTQYLRPNGRKRDVEIDMPQEVEDLAKRGVERLVRSSILRPKERGFSELGANMRALR